MLKIKYAPEYEHTYIQKMNIFENSKVYSYLVGLGTILFHLYFSKCSNVNIY